MHNTRSTARLVIGLAVSVIVTLAVDPSAFAQRQGLAPNAAGIQMGARHLWQSAATTSNIASNPTTRSNNSVKYKVTQIGVLPGKTNSFLPQAKSINNLGHATGYSYVSTGDFHDLFRTGQGFIWQDGKLKALPLLNGWEAAFGFALNDVDQVVGAANNVDPDGTIHQTAVRWDHGKPINLGTLFPGGNSYAIAVNILGVAVGNSFDPATSLGTPWVSYGGSLHALPLLPGMVQASAESINDFGIITGVEFNADESTLLPTLWYWNGTGYTAMSLGSFGGTFGDAHAINNLGQAVGYSYHAGNVHASPFLWDVLRGLQALPDLPGDTDAEGFEISDLGLIAGYSYVYDDHNNFISQRVAIWQNGIPIDLQTVIPSNIPTLTIIGNGNLLGQISVNTGSSDDGTLTGYVLTPK